MPFPTVSVTQNDQSSTQSLDHSIDQPDDIRLSPSMAMQSVNQTNVQRESSINAAFGIASINQSTEQSVANLINSSIDEVHQVHFRQSSDDVFSNQPNNRSDSLNINASFGIASVSSVHSPSSDQSNNQFTPPSYLRSQSLTVPAPFRPRSASDFVNQPSSKLSDRPTNQSSSHSPNLQSINQTNSPSNNQVRKPNVRSQSLSSLKLAESSLTQAASFQSISTHVGSNYRALLGLKRRFLRVCGLLLTVWLLTGAFTLYQFWYDNSLNHWTFAISGLSLLWLLCCQASGLFNQRVNAPSLYASSVNRWFRLYGIEFDRQSKELKVMSVKSIQVQARKEKAKKLQSLHKQSNSPPSVAALVLPHTSMVQRASSEALRQRVIAELEDEEDAAGPEGKGLVLTDSDYPKIRTPHKRRETDST